MELKGDMIDDLIDSLTTFQSLADPEGEEVLLYELADDISAYMSAACDDPECDCGGLPRAECMARKIVTELLDNVVDGITAPAEECPDCAALPGDQLCPACQRAKERAEAAAQIRADILSTDRLEDFYEELLGPRGPEYEYGYEVTDDSGIFEIVLAVFKEILGGEEFDGYVTDFQDTGGWMDQLLEEPDTGLLDYGRRLLGSAFSFLDRIFAPVMKLIYPRRYVYEYDETEQQRLQNMVTEERMAGSLRWILTPVQGMLTESKLAEFAVDPGNPGGYLSFPDFLIDRFFKHEYEGNTGLGILVSPDRLTATTGLISELVGNEDLKELSAEHFARDIADPDFYDEMLENVTAMLDPDDGDVKITETVNELIEGFLDCPECKGTGLIGGQPCANCGGVGQLDRLDLSLREWMGILSGGQDSLYRIAAMLEELSSECASCGGTGMIDGQPCERCDGSGRPQTEFDCPFCNGAGCAQCGGSGKTRPSLVLPGVPAMLLAEEDSRRAVGDYQAATIGPAVSALARVLRGEKARQIVYDLADEGIHILIDGLGTVLSKIIANENGEMLYMQEMMVEIFTFGDLPQKINKLLTGFLKDPTWLGECTMVDAKYQACTGWTGFDHSRKQGCKGNANSAGWNEPVPKDAHEQLPLGTNGSGLEYVLRLSLYYTIWNKPFPHNPPDDPDAHVNVFNHDLSEHSPSQMPAGWGQFWTVNYTKEVCAFNIFGSEIGQGAQIGIHRFNNALLEWLRGGTNFAGNDPQNPAVLQRPANFIPTYVEDYYRECLAGEFVPNLVEVLLTVLEEVFTYQDPVRGSAADIVASWLLPIIFTDPGNPTDVNKPWLFGDIANILEKEYGSGAAKFDLADLLEDVVIGLPDAQGIREMKMLDKLGEMLQYDPAEHPSGSERDHPPVWVLEEHFGTTFSNVLGKFADFVVGGWGCSVIPTLKQSGGDVYMELTLEHPVDEETVRIFKPCGVCEKCTANPPRPHECENPLLEAWDVVDPCDCENCQRGKACLHPTGTFEGPLVKAGGPRNAIDYIDRTIELSVNCSPGDELIVSWMPGLITYLTLHLEADGLRRALKLPEADSPGEVAPFDNLIYNNILKYIRHIDPDTGDPLSKVTCQFCDGTGQTEDGRECKNCNGGYLYNSASEQLCEYLLDGAAPGDDISPDAPGFHAGYIIADVPSRLIVDLLTAGATPAGDPADLAEHASGVVSGLFSDTLMNYRMGGRALDGIERILSSDAVFKALTDTLSGFFSNLLETFTRRITSFGGLLAGTSPAPIQSQAAGEHDRDPILQAAPAAGVKGIALLAGVPLPTAEIETAGAAADARTLADDIIKALQRMDTALFDEFINEMLAEDTFKENLSPLLALVGEIIGDRDLAGIIGGVLADNLQDGRLDGDIDYTFNTVMDFLADEEINKVSRQFVFSFLNSEELQADGAYVDNLIEEGVEIGFDLLRNIVENILLVKHPENPKVPGEKSEIVKTLAKQFVSTARKEFEGYEGFPGYQNQFQDLLTDPRLGDLLKFFAEILAESGIDLGLDLLEEPRTQPILTDILLVAADYALSGLVGIFGDSELTPHIFSCIDQGIRNTSGDNSYKFAQDSINDLVENLFYHRDGALFSHLSANFYKVMDLCGNAGYYPKNGVCHAKCRLNLGLAPDQNLVASLHPELATVPPELLIDVVTDWLVYGGGRPGAGTMSGWAHNIAAQIRPQLIYDATDPELYTLAKAYQESQDFMLDLLSPSHDLGGKPAILNKVQEALEEYPLSDIAAVVRDDPRLDPEALQSDDFQYYRGVSINHNSFGQTLTNFPVLVRLDAGNFDFSRARADGADIHFRLPDPAHPARPGGAAQNLTFERALYDPVNEVAEFYVLFPSISHTTDTRFMICYGGNSAPHNSTAVWKGTGRNYALVYHMRESGTTVKDSTGSHNGTKTGTIPLTTIDGRTGLDFRGRNFCVNSNKNASQLGIGGNTARTIEAWAYTTGFNNGAVFDIGTNANNQTFSIRTLDSNNRWRANLYGSNDCDFDYPSRNTWVHFAMVYSGGSSGQVRVYVNGEQMALTPTANFNLGDTKTFRVGQWAGSTTDHFEGIIDEVRISNVARSANWIRSSYEAGLGNAVKNIGPEIRGDYYIPRELATALIDILPLEEVGNILNIPVYTDRVKEEFTSTTFPPTGWTRTTPTANRWDRDASRGHDAPGAAKFTATEPPLLTNQELLNESFAAGMFPPAGWKVEPVEVTAVGLGDGWHKHLLNKDGGTENAAASMQWINDGNWRDKVKEKNSGTKTIHARLASPWFTFATGTGAVTFQHKKAGQDGRFTHAKVGVEYREGSVIKREELGSYGTGSMGTNFGNANFTIPAKYAGQNVRIYFDFKGTYDFGGNIGYFKWIITNVKVTGSRYGAPPLGEGRLISAPIEVGEKYVLEYYESSDKRHRFQSHAMGILNPGGTVLYRTELGRAPAYPDWQRRRLDLSEYTGQTVRFFFDYKGHAGDTWYLDDFLVRGFDRYLGEDPGDPVIFEQLEEAGHYAVDILPLVDLIDAVFADEEVIKDALDSFISDVIKGAIQVLGRSDIFFAAVDVLREFPIDKIGEFLREEYKIPCGYCEGCKQGGACELDPDLVGLTRAEYIGQILPEVLLGAGADLFLGEGEDGSVLADLIYGLLTDTIDEFGDGSPVKMLANIAVDLLTCGECEGCTSDPPGPCENNKLIPLVEALYELLGVANGNGSSPAEVQGQEAAAAAEGEDEKDAVAAYYADVPQFFTALWSGLYRAALGLLGGALQTDAGEEPATGAPTITTADSTVVDIPDEELRKAIGYALLLDNGKITVGDMKKLYALSVCERGITDLTGLEKAENLKFLDLYGNEIADLSPLSGLTDLEALHLSYAGLGNDDIAKLSGLTNLTELDLAYNEITNLSALDGLVNLEILNLNGNAVTNVAALAGMTDMKRLFLADNNIGNIGPLASMHDLERLNLGGNAGLASGGFAALAGKNSLERLNLDGTGISGAVPAQITGLAGLKRLDLGANTITNLGNLASMTELETLQIGANGLNNARLGTVNWSALTALRQLDLGDNSITNPTALSGLSELAELNLANNNISGLAALSGLTGLRSLNLSHNNIAALTGLDWKTFKALRYLYLASNNDSLLDELDISPLAPNGAATPAEDRLNLVELDLSGNAIEDISALAGVNFRDALWGFKAWLRLGASLEFEGIEYLDGEQGGFLDLSNNLISDTTPLAGKKLQTLNLATNEIKDASVLENVNFGGLVINGLLDLSNNWIAKMEAVGAPEGLDALSLRGNYLKIDYRCIRPNRCQCGKEPGDECAWVAINRLRQHSIIVADEEQIPGPAPQGVVGGQIFSPDGEPVAGAGVTVWEEGSGAELQLSESGRSYHTVTRADGSFRLPLPEGTYRVRIEHAAFDPVESGGLEVEKTGPTLEKQEIFLKETVGLISLGGKVVNTRGEPLDNLQVSLKEETEKRGGEILTGEAGTYELQLAAGTHVVEIRRDGYIPVTLEITVHADGTIEGAGETVIMDLLTCEGEVADVCGEPKMEAQITATDDDGREISGSVLADGTFTLGSFDELLLPGTYRVESKLAGYLPAVLTMTVDADGTIKGWDEAFVMELYGDVSNDGRVDIGDAILALKQIVGLTALDEKALLRARVSGHLPEDGDLSIRDAILILRHIVGLIDTFPADTF